MWFSHPLDFLTCQLSATLLWQILLVRTVQSAGANASVSTLPGAKCTVCTVIHLEVCTHQGILRVILESRDRSWSHPEDSPRDPKFPILLSRTAQWGSLPVGWAPLTIGVSTTLQSEPRDLWPLIRPIWVTLGDFRIFRRFSGFLGYFWMIFRF